MKIGKTCKTIDKHWAERGNFRPLYVRPNVRLLVKIAKLEQLFLKKEYENGKFRYRKC